MKQKGFTLLELLVVIAIIGLIGSIIMLYITNARNKGNDAKIKAQLASARSAAEIYFSNYSSYNGSAGNISGPCFWPDSMFTDEESGMSKFTDSSNYPTGVTLTCYSNGNSYAISATLPGVGGTNSWCIDSSGDAVLRATPINSPAC